MAQDQIEEILYIYNMDIATTTRQEIINAGKIAVDELIKVARSPILNQKN